MSNVGYLTDLAKDYERLTGQSILVRGGGSVLGLEELRSGKTDFAASCRGREPGDPDDVEFIQAAWDALVFIVHPSNPLASISLADVQGIYAGRIRDWGQLKGAARADRAARLPPPEGPERGRGFDEGTWCSPGRSRSGHPGTATLASTGIVEQIVEKTPAASRPRGSPAPASARSRCSR